MGRKKDDKVTKKVIVDAVSQRVRMHPDRVEAVVAAVLDTLAEEIGKGRPVELRNFGVFQPVVRRARPGRNPRQPDVVIPVPPRVSVVYKPGQRVQEMLRKLDPADFA